MLPEKKFAVYVWNPSRVGKLLSMNVTLLEVTARCRDAQALAVQFRRIGGLWDYGIPKRWITFSAVLVIETL